MASLLLWYTHCRIGQKFLIAVLSTFCNKQKVQNWRPLRWDTLSKLLGISYWDHITNNGVRDRIRQPIQPYDDILTTVKWFGNEARSAGLAKTILQGTVQGRRIRGRKKRCWENNISEWKELKFCDPLGESENGGKGLLGPWHPDGHPDYGISAGAGFSVCLCWLHLFCVVLWEFWLRLNEIHEVRTFAPCKVFSFLFVVVVFSSLEITLDSEQPMLE